MPPSSPTSPAARPRLTPAALRTLLAAQFPGGATAPPAGPRLATGVPALDTATGGGLPAGAVTEISCVVPSAGGHLVLGELLAVTRGAAVRVALVDAHDGFDPESFPPDALGHLVWVRCAAPETALPAADLLARDANFGLVVLDLRRLPESALRRLPAALWHRLRHAAETGGTVVVVETAAPAVPSARVRVVLGETPGLAALERERPGLVAALAPLLPRHRLAAAV